MSKVVRGFDEGAIVPDFDVIFVGGGLAGCLGALTLCERRPELRLAILEREPRLGGNHTWCFHAGDSPPRAHAIIDPLVVARWSGYAVRFPQRTRRLDSPYACITSERLHDVVARRLGEDAGHALLLGQTVTSVEPTRVRLADGRALDARLVVDARGPERSARNDAARSRGYQKFVGLELRVDPTHTLREPVLFDANLAQQDGFRFMYLLPLSPDRLLIEETFFSDTPGLDEEASTRAILAYARAQGFAVRERLRSERGVLPMPWRDLPFDVSARPLRAGYRGGLFHPVTGYSFPQAIRFALALADSDLASLARSPLADYADAQRAQRPFLHLLTRMLFTCFAPAQRFSVLEHFYRLPAPLIERFYAAELSRLDRARILIGAPPKNFSLTRALRLQTGTAHEASRAR